MEAQFVQMNIHPITGWKIQSKKAENSNENKKAWVRKNKAKKEKEAKNETV